MEKIDFVILWVDGCDPKWVEEKQKYEGLKWKNSNNQSESNSVCRYRDNGWLRYWFRSVEKFAPWVNQIFFITCGQKPEWLNVAHPKLRLVDHKDYMPQRYLPTFSSRVIDLNVHRINELSEKFVLFDDDMFLLQPLEPTFFFKQGLPVLHTSLAYTNQVGLNSWSRTVFNDYCVVNKSFNIKRSVAKNWHKWFNLKELGFQRTIKNLMCYLANHTLPVSAYGHFASPQLKSTLQEVWDMHPEILEQTSMHKFRCEDGVNPWLLCAWNQAKGLFYPTYKERLGRYVSITPDVVPWICSQISKGATPQICINDSVINTDVEESSKAITAAFEMLLPDKSMYEI